MKGKSMPAGFRVLKRQRKVRTDAVERFSFLPVANVSDSMSRLTAGGAHCAQCMVERLVDPKPTPGLPSRVRKLADRHPYHCSRFLL
jgi:hypothetical protein